MPEEYLLIQYHLGEISPDKRAEVEIWLEASEENKSTYREFVSLWEHSAQAGIFEEIDTKADWKELKKRMPAETVIKPLAAFRFQWQYAVAAAVVILIMIGGLAYWFGKSIC